MRKVSKDTLEIVKVLYKCEEVLVLSVLDVVAVCISTVH